ncbi:MAG: CHAT domain-containing protein, partial [Pseudomonadales bacterium]|nr:CHAT domain-containing protein [Pseudomonadales bacterium]
SATFDPAAGILAARRTTPAQGRFRFTGDFYRDIVLARTSLLADDAFGSLESTRRALQQFAAVQQAYDDIGADLLLADDLPGALQSARLLEAQALEASGDCQAAAPLFEAYTSWSESARSSISIEERIHFFRGTALPAYQGLIRCRASNALRLPGDETMNALLASIDQLKGRQFVELLNRKETDSPVNIQDVNSSISPGLGVLIFQDLGTSLLTILFSEQAPRLLLRNKPTDWDRRLFELRDQLASQAELDVQALQTISNELLGFAATQIATLDELYVLTDGALASVPPAVLSLPSGQMSGEILAITLLPSLSALRNQVHEANERQQRLLGLADPHYAGDDGKVTRVSERMISLRGASLLSYFEPLPETRHEVTKIAGYFGADTSLLLGRDAAESTLKALNLKAYSHIHFATHGLIGNELPGLAEPALVLSAETDEDGLLTASEVAQLDLDADLTILSACNTGNGDYFSGEGLLGMGRAFMVAGSRNVIVSLWPVDSLSTKYMMERLYEHMASGLSVSRSLFQAQRDLRQAVNIDATETTVRGIQVDQVAMPRQPESKVTGPFADPFYWSPFVLISVRQSDLR